MSYHDGFSAVYRNGVPWGTLRIDGAGTSGDIPETDFAESLVAYNEGCLALAVAPAEVEVEIRVAADGPPPGQSVIFAGVLAVPEGVFEVGDLIGDEFVYRFRVPVGEVDIAVSADVPEEATKICITVPAILGSQ